jgi:hypothetical protein
LVAGLQIGDLVMKAEVASEIEVSFRLWMILATIGLSIPLSCAASWTLFRFERKRPFRVWASGADVSVVN